MKKLEFTAIVDRIYAKGRPRFARGFTYTPKNTKKMENWIKAAFIEKYPDHIIVSKNIPIKLHITAYFKIPKSISKKKISEMIDTPCLKTPDFDNIGKLIDALNGIVFEDDCIIYDGRVLKLWTDKNERLEITIEYQELD